MVTLDQLSCRIIAIQEVIPSCWRLVVAKGIMICGIDAHTRLSLSLLHLIRDQVSSASEYAIHLMAPDHGIDSHRES